ncbi:MAG: Manganese/iron superoxide dismutase-like protein, partial [Chlamydiia bacterium]|nr:Manganese/iron superoxide dismutase-like protein [Chlamydiia bacterium]
MRTKILAIFLLITAQLPSQDDFLDRVNSQKTTFELPPLPYSSHALEPYIDARTMEIHHDRHHKTYVDNLNKAIANTQWTGKTLPELFTQCSSLPIAIRNNAGGHWNHSFYWDIMTADPHKRKMSERLEKEIVKYFGSIAQCKEEFRNAGLQRFASGYAWLIRARDGSLKIISTANQDNPLMNDAQVQGSPILIVDVWEHAYYLHYQNLRGDYLDA